MRLLLRFITLLFMLLPTHLAGGESLLDAKDGFQTPYDRARIAVINQPADSPIAGTTIYDMLLDRDNVLWVAGQEGVFRVEGNTGIPLVFPAESPSGHVRAIAQTQDGTLWFGSEAGGLWQYNQGVWSNWNKANGLPADRVNALHLDHTQKLWVGTSHGIVCIFPNGSTRIYNLGSGLPHLWVWKIREMHTPEGKTQMWAATEGGVVVLEGDRWQKPDIGPGLPQCNSNDIIEIQGRGRQQEYWVSAWKKGLFQWKNGQWIQHDQSKGLKSLTLTSLTTTHLPNQESILWVGSYEAGLFSYQNGVWRHHAPGKDLPATGVYSLKSNPSGRPTLWMGSRGAGLLSLNLAGWRVLDEKTGLPAQDVVSIANIYDKQEGDCFWIGTDKGIFRWANGQWKADPALGGLPDVRINVMLCPKDLGGGPVLWACTINGVSRWHKGRWTHFTEKDGLPFAQAWGIREIFDEEGKSIIMAGSEKGLLCFEDNRWRILTQKDGLPHTWITDVCQIPDPDGSLVLWVASRGGGVSYRKNGKWHACNHGLNVPIVNQFALTRSKDGKPWLWASNSGVGLARINPWNPDAGWTCYSDQDFPHMPANMYRLIQDRQGSLWGASTRTIVRFRLEDQAGVPTPISVENHTLGDGLPAITRFNPPALDLRGNLWFGTIKGVAVLDPVFSLPEDEIKKPILKGITCDDRPFYSQTPPVFNYKISRIVFEFFFPIHHRAEDTRYRTQILGLESRPGPWYPESRRGLTGVSPGSYTLRVWAMDHQGHISQPLDLPFTLEAPPWLRPWALALYVLAGIAAIAGFFHVRELLLRRKNKELEALVAQRTRELEKTNEGLLELNHQHREAIEELNNALTEVKNLQGIIPICMQCKKIRDDAGYWNQLEAYISKHSDVKFSHGYCPECATAAQRELEEYKAQNPPLFKRPWEKSN